MELVAEKDNTVVYKDFAHSPSKLKATTEALSNQFPERRLVACMELHTFSSLNSSFLEQYRGSMHSADVAYVYFSPETLKHKKLKEISADDIHEAFGSENLVVFTSSDDLQRVMNAGAAHLLAKPLSLSQLAPLLPPPIRVAPSHLASPKNIVSKFQADSLH